MTANKNSQQENDIFKHPFMVILAAIILIYLGYLFGGTIYQLTH